MTGDKPKPKGTGGFYPTSGPDGQFGAAEWIAAGLSALWLIAGLLFWFVLGGENAGPRGVLSTLVTLIALFLPIALIWVAATAARTVRQLREEAARVQASLDAMRIAYIGQSQGNTADPQPEILERLDEILKIQRDARERLEESAALRPVALPGAVPVTPAPEAAPQPTLGLGTPAEVLAEPLSVAEFIKALDFPETENDKEGFRALRRALSDRTAERLVRASQDVLTILSQEGIYMDDLRPDLARPELWRRFAAGERGKAVAALGGITDRTALALASGRMRQDPVFRDAAHHFLRTFDRVFMEFEKTATDAEIAEMSNTRTARAFMLLGRVAGTFD